SPMTCGCSSLLQRMPNTRPATIIAAMARRTWQKMLPGSLMPSAQSVKSLMGMGGAVIWTAVWPAASHPAPKLVIQLFVHLLERFAGEERQVGFIQIDEPIQVRPQERQPFVGDGVDRVEHALPVVTGQGLPEPLQRLPFPQ